MNVTTIIFLLPFAAVVGFGIGVGIKAARALNATRGSVNDSDRQQQRLDKDRRNLRLLTRPVGKKRDSAIAGIAKNLIRHKDGSYTRAYHIQLSPSIFDHEERLEQRIDELSRLLACRKRTNTVIQFRLAISPDPGRALSNHLKTKDESNILSSADLLHMMGVDFYDRVAAQGGFRQQVLSAWVRVPVKHHNDEAKKGFGAFLPTLKREREARGTLGFLAALLAAVRATTTEAITQRTVAEERQAIDEAEKTFRQIEHQSPIKLNPFSRAELWNALYLGHCQNSDSVPQLPNDPGCDVNDYLSGETIAGDGNFVLHGNFPAAVVSLFVPPQPNIFADCMRTLTTNSQLSFRHTIVTEYVHLDQNKIRKRLDKRIRQVSRANKTHRHGSFEGRKAISQLSDVREEIAGDTQALVKVRVYVVIYSEQATVKTELIQSTKNLDRYCEQIVTAIRRIPGADAAREEPAALRAVYHRSLVGELDHRDTGREILETADSLAPLTATESAWTGSPRPHTLCSTPTGHLTGFDLYDRTLVNSPLVLLIAQPRGGKSVFMCRIITDLLASKADLRVRAVDYGKSLAPLVEVLGGRYLRFDEGAKTINTWDYPGLELGEMPSDLQIAFVVADLMQLTRATDTVAEDIFIHLVREVYKNHVPRNQPGRDKHEPRLSHMIELLRITPFKYDAANERCESLAIALESFRDDAFLDAPTHPDFLLDSRLDVYEIDSLGNLPDRVRESMAFRIAAHVMRSIGKQNRDGTRSPVLLAFDEVWEIVRRYPRILQVIERAARTGGKENAVTMLASHAYEDFTGTAENPNPIGISLAKTAGVKLIGKQVGDYSRLLKDARLSDNAQRCIEGIRNVPGEYAQFLAVFGAGQDSTIEMLQVDLSPTELWTYTTNPDERNARSRVAALKPDWPMSVVVAYLSQAYPRGLTAAALTEIDESLLATDVAA
ncbi:MAG: type secretion system protein TrbE [Blastocatellia bacterium]|nr:type secretion system protein TrbE [Blastocatellia bacterium]